MTIGMTFSAAEFSIHAPREGRDPTEGNNARTLSVFQSTRPVRGATLVPLTSWAC